MVDIKEEIDEEEVPEEEVPEEEVPEESPTTPDNNRLKCPSCTKVFWNRYSLNKHVARVHEKRYKEYERKKNYACTYDGCEKAYTTPGLLRDHETTHTGLLIFLTIIENLSRFIVDEFGSLL